MPIRLRFSKPYEHIYPTAVIFIQAVRYNTFVLLLGTRTIRLKNKKAAIADQGILITLPATVLGYH